MMKQTKHTNIFDALEDDQGMAENLKIRAMLMHAVSDYIQEQALTQQAAAGFFEVNQPRISDLVNGKIDKFTIDMLVNMLAKTGQHVDVIIKQAAA